MQVLISGGLAKLAEMEEKKMRRISDLWRS
jgi:hypothetical protein